MKHLLVLRTNKEDDKQTIGKFNIFDENGILLGGFESLERGWLDNQVRVSCIPTGTYDIVLEYSPGFKKNLWEIKGVPGRSECKIHTTNYWHQINGCIALGLGKADINGDERLDMTRSGDAMKSFHAIMGDDKKAQITIINLEK